ncbi:hypothetical protein HanRHA438_Chr16g0778441 [Helianthus annuus]|nr:hypothetical protein HanRHA438_Chr16g0778441 [Helianthus annuus]
MHAISTITIHNLQNKKEPPIEQYQTLMAKSVRSKVLLLICIIFFFLCVTSNANEAMHNDNSSQLLIRKLGLKVSDLEYYKRRSLGANPDRVAPGGPDGQHHFANSPLAH